MFVTKTQLRLYKTECFNSSHKNQHLGNTCSVLQSKTKLLIISVYNFKCGSVSKSYIQAELSEVKAIFPPRWKQQEAISQCWKTSPFLVEVPVGEHERGHQGPQVEGQAEPAGADLHPDGRHGGLHGVVVGLWPGEPRTRSKGSQCWRILLLSEGLSQE